MREGVAGLLLAGLGDRKKGHQVWPHPILTLINVVSSTYSPQSQSHCKSVTVLGPGHMTAYDGPCKHKPTNQVADETPLSSRLAPADTATDISAGGKG